MRAVLQSMQPPKAINKAATKQNAAPTAVLRVDTTMPRNVRDGLTVPKANVDVTSRVVLKSRRPLSSIEGDAKEQSLAVIDRGRC